MKKILKKLCATSLALLMATSALVIPTTSAANEDVFILPDSADNSASPYFPEIGNQGSMGSCTSWAHVYYSFTYAINKSRGIKTTPENTFSPVVTEVRTVTFTNTFFWSGEIKCYYWSDSNTSMTAWPGVTMQNAGTNDFGETMYTFDVPKGATWIIFTNGSSQTVDIPFAGEAKYYPINTTDKQGHFSVKTW